MRSRWVSWAVWIPWCGAALGWATPARASIGPDAGPETPAPRSVLSAPATPVQTAAARAVVAHEVADGPVATRLALTLEDGTERDVVFERGRVLVDGRRVGSYERGGALERAFRDLLSAVRERDGAAAQAAYDRLAGLALAGPEASALEALRTALGSVRWKTLGARAAGARAAGETAAAGQATQAPAAAEPAAPAAPAAPAETAEAPPRRARARGGVVLEIESLDDVARWLEDLGVEPGSILLRRLRDLETPIKVVAGASRYELPAGDTLRGSLVLLDTPGTIAGVVEGDVAVVDATLRLEDGAVVRGDVLSVDGDVRDRGATIGGAIAELEGAAIRWRPWEQIRREIEGPLAPGRRFLRNLTDAVEGVFGTFGFYLFLGLLGVLGIYFLRPKLETVADTVSASFGRALLVGLAAEAVFPVACLVLVVLIVTLPLVPLYVLGMVLGSVFGYLGVAYAAGRNVLGQPAVRQRVSWSGAYARLLVGLALLLALFLVAAIFEIGGWGGLFLVGAIFVTWLAGTAGLGAVILSRFGTRRDFAGPPEPVAPAAAGAGAPGGFETEGRPGGRAPGGPSPEARGAP
jgi:hypothetical protein